jgi:hypothetical protein
LQKSEEKKEEEIKGKHHLGVNYEYEYPTNIRKNSKSFLGMPIGTRRSCLMEKTGDEKSRDTVPLSSEWILKDIMTILEGRRHVLVIELYSKSRFWGESDR